MKRQSTSIPKDINTTPNNEIRRPKHDLKWYYSYYKFKSQQFIKKRWKLLILLFVWCFGFYFMKKNEFLTIYIIITIIGLMFTIGLDWREKTKEEKEKSLSAWSVFNKNFEKIPGTFTAEDNLNQMTGGALQGMKKRK
ncbi:hypothetical protein ABK040_002893 [Willaertia magna]